MEVTELAKWSSSKFRYNTKCSVKSSIHVRGFLLLLLFLQNEPGIHLSFIFFSLLNGQKGQLLYKYNLCSCIFSITCPPKKRIFCRSKWLACNRIFQKLEAAVIKMSYYTYIGMNVQLDLTFIRHKTSVTELLTQANNNTAADWSVFVRRSRMSLLEFYARMILKRNQLVYVVFPLHRRNNVFLKKRVLRNTPEIFNLISVHQIYSVCVITEDIFLVGVQELKFPCTLPFTEKLLSLWWSKHWSFPAHLHVLRKIQTYNKSLWGRCWCSELMFKIYRYISIYLYI